MEAKPEVSFFSLNDEFCQLNACVKFEIKKLEAYSAWVMHLCELTSDHLIKLKVIYSTVADYYENLISPELNQIIDTQFFSNPVSSSAKNKIVDLLHNNLLENYKIIEEKQRELVMANTRSDKNEYMIRMSKLYREFSAQLEQHLKSSDEEVLKETLCELPVFTRQEKKQVGQSHNEKLESLFRFLNNNLTQK